MFFIRRAGRRIHVVCHLNLAIIPNKLNMVVTFLGLEEWALKVWCLHSNFLIFQVHNITVWLSSLKLSLFTKENSTCQLPPFYGFSMVRWSPTSPSYFHCFSLSTHFLPFFVSLFSTRVSAQFPYSERILDRLLILPLFFLILANVLELSSLIHTHTNGKLTAMALIRDMHYSTAATEVLQR